MRPTTVRFYFDYVSPNAYVAWSQLPAIAERYGVAIEPVPVLFAGLLTAHGRIGPGEVPAQMRWMWKNVLRKTTLLGVPLNPPESHPFNPLLALRVSSLPLSTVERTRLIDALFAAVWARGSRLPTPVWSSDFPNLALYLDGEDPVEPAAWARWSDPPRPSAVRPRPPRAG